MFFIPSEWQLMTYIKKNHNISAGKMTHKLARQSNVHHEFKRKLLKAVEAV